MGIIARLAHAFTYLPTSTLEIWLDNWGTGSSTITYLGKMWPLAEHELIKDLCDLKLVSE